jgi:hypothetical protein
MRYRISLGIVLEAGTSRVRLPTLSLDSPVGIILPASLWLWSLTGMNTKNLPEGKVGRQVKLATSPPSVSQFSSQICV